MSATPDPNPAAARLDERDLKLLDRIQQEIPLVERPFDAIARELGMTEPDVIARIERLRARQGGVIRQVSAIFDSRTLGYESSLVAAKVEEARLDHAVSVINAHPGVSHNYRRDHPYNVWYTVAVPPQSRLGLEKTVDVLHHRSGAVATRLMPSLRMFKIGVRFSLSADDDAVPDRFEPAATALSRPTPRFVASPRDKQLIRQLQQDLPACERPFDGWAQSAESTVAELLSAARRYQEIGAMRRFSAVLRHRQAGFGANAMGAWVVAPEQHERFGQLAAGFSSVSHCYVRPTYTDWPYSVFTMVHGKTREECETVLRSISRATGTQQFAALYSTHEYKKVRVKYFTPEIDAWEAGAVASGG